MVSTHLCKSQTVTIENSHTPSVDIQIFSSADEIPIVDWYQLVPESKIHLRRDFLVGIEQAKPSGASFKYVMIYEDGRPVLFTYFQLIPFDVQKIKQFAKSAGTATSFRSRLKNRLALWTKALATRFKIRILVIGNALFTGDYGLYARPDQTPGRIWEHLQAAICQIKNEGSKFSVVLLKDFQQKVLPSPEFLNEHGYYSCTTDADMRLNDLSEWDSYEAYLFSMKTKYRQRAKSADKKSIEITSRELSLSEIIAHKKELLNLFEEVATGDKFSLMSANEDYFPSLKEQLEDRFMLNGYFKGNELVGFSTLIRNGENLEAHFIGYKMELNRSHKLYQRMLYDMVRQGIDIQVNTLLLGRTAMEIKSTIGAKGYSLNCYLHVRNPLLNRFAEPILNNLEFEEWVPRHPFKEDP